MGNDKIFELLTNKWGDVKKAANDGTTVLHAAAVGGNKIIAQKIVGKWADVNARTKNGITPLMLAALQGICCTFLNLLIMNENNPVYTKNTYRT